VATTPRIVFEGGLVYDSRVPRKFVKLQSGRDKADHESHGAFTSSSSEAKGYGCGSLKAGP